MRAEHIERSLLLDAIAASRARIVVVTAPPGFGKSTLLAQWAGHCADAGSVVWVSLDADDCGAGLWSALLTALRDVLGSDLDPALDAAEAPDVDLRSGVLIALLDALAAWPESITLFVDDLHLALSDPVTINSLDWVISRLPSRHRVVAASRSELGLGSLRARGDVLDLRAEDLRFAGDEVSRFLRDGLGLDLDRADVAALEQHTEGWPAGLYLAAIRLRVGDDIADIIRQLAAGGEDLFGVLTDEVLRSVPEHECRFIRDTAVLDRFNADLCVRVLGDEAVTRGAFRMLTRRSLLVSELDNGRTWFRCHYLLREVLYSRLLEDDPERARELHRRAGAWFESAGGESELHEAMHHYLAAKDWDLAAELLARHSIRFVQSGALGGRARDWYSRFPAPTRASDPRLCYVGALLAALDGDRDQRDTLLADAQRIGWDGPMPDGTASLRLAGLSLRAMICFDDPAGALAAAQEALDELAPASPARSAVQALRAWHAYLVGETNRAERYAQQALAGEVHLPSAGLPLVACLPVAVLALVACERGHLELAALLEAGAVAARDSDALRTAPHLLPVACASARLQTLLGRPEQAVEHCRAGLALARVWRDSSLMVPAVLLELARAHAALGRLEEAVAAARAARARLGAARGVGALAADLEAFEPGRARPARADGLAARVNGTAIELSAREIDVLRAIAGCGSLREIANTLYISHNTIKTHTRALYAKLGIGTREEAVRRGRELGLLVGPLTRSRDVPA